MTREQLVAAVPMTSPDPCPGCGRPAGTWCPGWCPYAKDLTEEATDAAV